MKIDKSTALFLTKVLFHYEQLVKQTPACAAADLADRVQQLRDQFNDYILSEDECVNCLESEEDDHQLDDELEPNYDFSVSIENLARLSRLNGKIKFVHMSNDKVNLCEDDHTYADVKYVKRTGKLLHILTGKMISGINHDTEDVDCLDNWVTYHIPKFPTDWTCTLECGTVYKCVLI